MIARLDGTARRHVHEQGDPVVAVAELVEIATERRKGQPARLRVDLLTHVAGTMLGAHRHDPAAGWAAPAAIELLVAAGADREGLERWAVAAEERLRVSRRPGIGNP